MIGSLVEIIWVVFCIVGVVQLKAYVLFIDFFVYYVQLFTNSV